LKILKIRFLFFQLKESKNLIKELQDRVERLEISQKTFEKKRQLSKFTDLTSSSSSVGGGGSLSSSFSITPTINTNYEQQTPKETSIHGDEERMQRNSKLLQTSDLPSTTQSSHQDQMTHSTSTLNTESSSPTLSSRSSTSSSSASNSPQESAKETTLNDDCNINKTPISTKKQKKLSTNDTNDLEN
jgi:hypothetical protein